MAIRTEFQTKKFILQVHALFAKTATPNSLDQRLRL